VTNALRPMTVGELLDRTFFLYRSHVRLFLGIAALPNLITLAFQLSRVVIEPGSSGFLSNLIWVPASLLVYLVTIAVSQGATVIAVSQIQLGRDTSIADAFATIRPRIGELSMITLAMGIMIAVGFVLLLVPGIVLSMMWALTIPVAVLEARGLRASLARSSELTRGHRWRVFLIYVLIIVLVYIVSLLVQGPLVVALTILSGPLRPGRLPVVARVAIPVAGFVTQSVLSPIMTIALSLVYYDERVRKEAFDLEHMMQQMDRTAGTPSPAA
jgi:glycerophosphoryl diester phosphodiesterase family protein